MIMACYKIKPYYTRTEKRLNKDSEPNPSHVLVRFMGLCMDHCSGSWPMHGHRKLSMSTAKNTAD